MITKAQASQFQRGEVVKVKVTDKWLNGIVSSSDYSTFHQSYYLKIICCNPDENRNPRYEYLPAIITEIDHVKKVTVLEK